MKDKRTAMKDVGTVYDAYITFHMKVEEEGPMLPLDEYEDYVSIWAESRYLRGRTLYAARAANVKTDVEWKIRYREDLDETMRVKIKKQGVEDEYKFYEIEGILPLDNNRMYMTVKAFEIKHDM